MKITNKLGLPSAFLEAVKNDTYCPGKSDITTTQLIDSPRKVQLVKRHFKDIEVDVADRIWLLFGSVAHEILERSELKALVEKRIYMDILGWTLGCQFDRLLLEEGLLQDYKITSVWSIKGEHKPEWEKQLNVMRLALIHNWYRVDKLQIVAVGRDWRRGERKQNKDYPAHQVTVIDIPVWPMEQTEEYVLGRVKMHQEASKLEDDKLPLCAKEERWLRGECWALKKEGNKRASKLYYFENEAASACADKNAEDDKNKWIVEYRKGESVRCADYCEARPWCNQAKEEFGDGQD